MVKYIYFYNTVYFVTENTCLCYMCVVASIVRACCKLSKIHLDSWNQRHLKFRTWALSGNEYNYTAV